MWIQSPDELGQYVPHAVAPAKGDRTLFEKILPYISLADSWVSSLTCSESFLADHTSGASFIDPALRTATACHALAQTLSLLDVVMTPNGIGVVSTDSIVPASRERTAAMRANLLRMRDNALLRAVLHLMMIPEWRKTPAAENWIRSVFPFHSPVFIDGPEGVFSLDRYFKLSTEYSGYEMDIANKALSPALLLRLRHTAPHQHDPAIPAPERQLIARVQRLVNRYRESSCPPTSTEYSALVDHIRKHIELWPEWETSRQAQLWRLPGFSNDRKSSGFFF